MAGVECAAETGGPRRSSRPWAMWEIRLLRDLYPVDGAIPIAKRLGRTPMAVQGQAFKQGVFTKRFWTPEDDARLAAELPTLGPKLLGIRMGRSRNSVSSRAWSLGIAGPRKVKA